MFARHHTSQLLHPSCAAPSHLQLPSLPSLGMPMVSIVEQLFRNLNPVKSSKAEEPEMQDESSIFWGQRLYSKEKFHFPLEELLKGSVMSEIWKHPKGRTTREHLGGPARSGSLSTLNPHHAQSAQSHHPQLRRGLVTRGSAHCGLVSFKTGFKTWNISSHH